VLGSPVTITAPAVEALELDAAKRFLRLDGSSLDEDVRMLVAAARGDVENRTGLRLINQVVEVLADNFDDLAALNVGPVQSIAEIRFVPTDGAEQAMNAATYRLTGAGLERGIVSIGGTLRTGQGFYRARLNVGFGDAPSDIPPELRWAMLALVSGKFNDKPIDIEPHIVNQRILG